MAKIQELLDNLLHKKLGRDVRQSIHDSIEQCYKDATGHPESVAGVIEENKNLKQAMAKQDARINNLAKLPGGSTSGDAELADIRVGADGETYDTAGQAVREQIGSLKSDTSRIKKSLKTTYVDMNLFALGTINKDTGEEESSNKILRSIIDVNATEDITIKLPKGYQWNVAHWLAGKYRSDLWNENDWNQNLTIGKTTMNYKYRILIRRSDGADITLSELIGVAETNREDLQSFDKIDDLKKKLNEVDKKVDNLSIETDTTLTKTGKAADSAVVGQQIDELKEDLEYKINSRLTPVQFETVLGYYNVNGFVTGKKEWGARLMRVPCKKGDKYLYHGYCDNIYGVSFLDSEFRIIQQISVPKNKEFEMDVNAIDNASYIDFYSGHISTKTYVLKYNREDTSNNDVGKIFVDASSQFIGTDNKYFSPIREELVYGAGMKLKEITPENDTVFKFSFTQHQAATAYVDDFCIATSNNYVSGTEVFHENIIVFVPKGKTLRINDFNSNVHVSKFEKLVPITEKYINEKIPDVPKTVDAVTDGESNPVSSNAVYHAIKTNVVQVSTGLPYIAVASSEAPTAIKSVCQYVCDGTNDNIEIQNAINSLGSAGGKVFLTKGKFFISAPIDTGDTLVELCGEGALLDLHEDTLNSNIRGGTILQAVGNTDLVHIGGAKGTTVHDIAFFGYGRNKADNTSYGIKFTGYADTDRIYNCGFTNCAIAIGSDITTDVIYIHNLSVQRNKIGIALYRTDAEIHDCLFCENIGMETVVWDDNTYDINCADICVSDGKIYNNTFRRSGMCYDIYKVYGNESGLESDDVKPISSVVARQRAYITGNKFYDCIYANCIRIMMKPDFLLIEGNSFTKWGHKDQTDDSRKSAICFDKGSVLGTIMNNRFYSDSNTDKFTDKYAIYEVSIGNDDSYWSYSNTYANNFIGNLTGETDNKCVIVGTSVNNKFINNIIAEKYKDTAVVN